MSKLQFCLIVSEQQLEAINESCSEKSYYRLRGTYNYFDNIRDYTLTTEYAISVIYEQGWEPEKIYTVETPDPLTLDLSTVPHARDSRSYPILEQETIEEATKDMEEVC